MVRRNLYRWLTGLLSIGLVALPAAAVAWWPSRPAGEHVVVHDVSAEHTADHASHTPPAVAHAQPTVVPSGYGHAAWDGQLPAWTGDGRQLRVEADGDLAAAVRLARPGDHIVVSGGTHDGPFTIAEPIWLEGTDGATLTGGRAGTVLQITAPGARVSGFVITGTGISLNQEHAGVLVDRAADVTVAGNTVQDALFGIVAKQSPRVQVIGNSITGKTDLELSLAGDGIRIWHSDGARVAHNTVRGTRELIVENTDGAELTGNAIVDGRQGMHLMRAPNVTCRRNYLGGNSNGIYVMYGANTVVQDNWIETSRGPSGYGLALKEADAAVISGNWTVGNRVGMYLDNSPLRSDMPNEIERNLIAYNDLGFLLTPASRGNRILGNDMLDNLQQVSATGGGGGGSNNIWSAAGQGNYWSDYAGYDSDRDGIGDSPYAPVRAFEGWMDRQPELRWLWYAPAAIAADFAARAFPIGGLEPWLVDEYPTMEPAERGDRP